MVLFDGRTLRLWSLTARKRKWCWLADSPTCKSRNWRSTSGPSKYVARRTVVAAALRFRVHVFLCLWLCSLSFFQPAAGMRAAGVHQVMKSVGWNSSLGPLRRELYQLIRIPEDSLLKFKVRLSDVWVDVLGFT